MNAAANTVFHIGVVEDRADPLKLGRCKVRVSGLHTYDKVVLPTSDLPWAVPMQPVTSASVSGIGVSPNGLVEGSTVVIIFQDPPYNQYPIIIGSIMGIPQPDGVVIGSSSIAPTIKDAITPSGRPVPTTSQEADSGICGVVDPSAMKSSDALLTICGDASTVFDFRGILDALRYGNAVSRSSTSPLGIYMVGLGRGYNRIGDAIERVLLPTGSLEQSAKSVVPILGSIDPSTAKSVIDSIPDIFPAISLVGDPDGILSSLDSAILGGSVSLGAVSLASPSPSNVSGLSNSGEVLRLGRRRRVDAVSLEGSEGFDLLDEAEISLRGSETYKSMVESDGEGGTPSLFGSFGGINHKAPRIRPSTPKEDKSLYAGSEVSVSNTSIPPWYKGPNPSSGISALRAAASKHSLSSAQVATLLAIIGVETEWKPAEESYFYHSPENLCRKFPQTFNGDISLARAYCNWKGGREDFFNFVYHPSRQGRRIGNVKPNDGSRFVGRGMLPIVGRSMYSRYSEILNKPVIIEEPWRVSDDIDIAAEIAVLYFLDNVSGIPPTSHPQFFYSAVKRFGKIDDISLVRKREYYEHFYGVMTPEWFGFDNKVSGNAIPPKSFHGVNTFSDKAGDPFGFKDPNSKYPLSRYANEPDTNRLARGIASETVVQIKESKRSVGVPIALDGGFWSQPSVPYSATYPHNKVSETESGHLQEFDDTPGSERMHWYHRRGTFMEWDSNGNEVRKIVGNGYTIIDKSGFISIEGDCNLTVGGRVNILCKSDANIEVSGSAEMRIGGNMDIGVAGDMNVAVGGNFSVWSDGAMNLQCGKNMHVLSKDLFLSSDRSTFIKSEGNTFLESTLETHIRSSSLSCESVIGPINMKSATSLSMESEDDLAVKSGGSILAESTRDTSMKAGNMMSIGSLGMMNFKAESSVAIDGINTLVQMGVAVPPPSAPSARPSSGSVKAIINGMSAPSCGSPRLLDIPWNTTSQQFYEDRVALNVGVETNLSRMVILDAARSGGVMNDFRSVAHSSSGGSGDMIRLDNENIILTTRVFTADFRLSNNFTLGMLFDGGFGYKHRLIPNSGLSIQEIVCNLSLLSINILERCIEFMPDGMKGIDRSWRIISGYRMSSIGIDDHSTGRVIDIALMGGHASSRTTFEIAKKISSVVPFNTLSINYAGDLCWISISYRGDGTYGGGSNDGVVFTTRDYREIGKELILLG